MVKLKGRVRRKKENEKCFDIDFPIVIVVVVVVGQLLSKWKMRVSFCRSTCLPSSYFILPFGFIPFRFSYSRIYVYSPYAFWPTQFDGLFFCVFVAAF